MFAIAVRVVFTHALNQQVTEKLVALGQGAATGLELENGHLSLQSDFPVQSLIDRNQALEWFDSQGRSMGKQGHYRVTLLFAGKEKEAVQTQVGTPRIRGVTLPVMSSDSGRLMGYVRASQSLEEFDETLRKLDWGLGGGVIVALMLSGVGGAILTRQAMQPAEQSFERLKQFTADASHELRSPLMAIETNVEVALTYPEWNRSKGDTEKFEAIASATSQMTRLTEDLLFLARTDQLPNHHREILNLADLLDDLVRLYQAQAETKNIGLQASGGKSLYLLGDAGQLKRLFTNLIVNALQYTAEGGRVEIECHLVGKQIIISVKDTGMGILPEQLDRVFDRFWRAEQSRSYQSGGSGLGLAIAQAIAQSHGGLITVTSQPGVGSCFTVRLPVVDTHSNPKIEANI
ncbi:ATP-binding protein [Synechococcus sp. PCC 6312]|uniref:sensor histidine kinase n=1 Tax=Synechococcus sp. (strain ATCC 27167 / PCC 6312) TaxID=195253 RepID=UPI00209D4C42|nr:ATP-binding protein [Synechococcus sp. PCC 6312]